MKIYTGGGDRGKTSLFSGERVAKNNPRVEAYGTVDELNSFIGAVLAGVPESESLLQQEITQIQAELFQVGAWMATTHDSAAAGRLTAFTAAPAQALEDAIDRMQAELPPMRGFILPHGHLSAALAHVARTVCRRAERLLIALIDQDELDTAPEPLQHVGVYLNRLSDYLFVLARYLNHIHQIPEKQWQP